MPEFAAELDIIGVNPFVFVPEDVLETLFVQAGKTKGPIPIRGNLNDQPYRQTLVRFQGAWRLYVNTAMLKNSPGRIGEIITVSVQYDPEDRRLSPHPRLAQALNENEAAQAVFDRLTPSLQQEIIRYIGNLKSEQSVARNVQRAIRFLLGQERFIGRDPIQPE